jgi:hypothetical protein
MKRLILGLLLAAAMLFATPLSANAAEYETFVGCDDLDENPVPAHVCQIGDFPGAFFASDVDTEYEVCVEFPDGEEACSEENFAEAGFLYVNSIFSELEGDHLVTWYVEGAEIGSWLFRLDPPPPPPVVTPVPVPSATPPPPAVLGPSAQCIQAKQRVAKLKRRLRNANGRNQRVKMRGKLRKARAAQKRVC